MKVTTAATPWAHFVTEQRIKYCREQKIQDTKIEDRKNFKTIMRELAT